MHDGRHALTSAWPIRADRPLVGVLRALPSSAASAMLVEAALLFERAERHGVSGVVHDAWLSAGAGLPSELHKALETQRIVRELDHEAHVALLSRIDAAFAEARIRGVLLKGAAFAKRFYPRPSARATSDIDLLVDEPALEQATAALASVGYVVSESPRQEEWSRREHHHLHLAHPHALPLELHFHAYRGFGQILRSAPLLEASTALDAMRALRVLSAEDELVYLAVHAAAHRFVRLGWLYDLKLLIATMSDDALDRARSRAELLGFARVLAFTGTLLASILDVERALRLGDVGRWRNALALRLFAEPTEPSLRSLSRFALTIALCDSPRAASTYAVRASRERMRLAAQRA